MHYSAENVLQKLHMIFTIFTILTITYLFKVRQK